MFIAVCLPSRAIGETSTTSGWNTHRAPRGEVKVMLGPAPHIFSSELLREGFAPAYAEKLQSRYHDLRTRSVPVVFTLMHLSKLSGVQWSVLRSVANRMHPGADYKVYPKRKRSGGNRWISVPTPQLCATQTWIAHNILNSAGALAMVHPAATAYAKGSSVLKNAQPHAGAPWILKIDIQSFFESVSERQVYHALRRLGYNALLSFEMARICTRVIPSNPEKPQRRDHQARWQEKRTAHETGPYPKAHVGHLPQGAPTSPMLSNLVAAPIDAAIQSIADTHGAMYTRYADDLVLSFPSGPRERIEEVLIRVRRLLGDHGFILNRKKTRILGPGARKIVTGLLVNPDSPRLPRGFKAHLSAALYHLNKHGIVNCSSQMGSKHPLSYLDHVRGLIQFAHSIEPGFADKMSSRLESLLNKERDLVDLLESYAPAGHIDLTRH